MTRLIALSASKASQHGATLLVTMVFMLLITLIAVSALKDSTQQTKLIATVERKSNTFQQSESVLAQHNHNNLFAMLPQLRAANNGGTREYVSSDTLSEALSSDSPMTVSSEVRLLGTRKKAMVGEKMVSLTEGSPVPNIIEIRSSVDFDDSDINTTIRQGRMVIAPPDSSSTSTTN